MTAEKLSNSKYSKEDLRAFFRNRKFLIVIGSYQNIGGAERQAIILGDFLKNEISADVRILASGGGSVVERMLDECGINHCVIPFPEKDSRWQRAKNLFRLLTRLRRDIRPEFIIPFIGYNSKVMALIYKAAGAKYCLWNQRDEGRGLYGSRAERWALNRVHHIVSNSFEGRDFLCKTYNVPKEAVKVVNNGIVIPDTLGLRPYWRLKLDISEKMLVVTMLANLTGFKDHETLLKAWSVVNKEINVGETKAMLLLAGAYREMTTKLKLLAFEERLCDSVIFLGRVDKTMELLHESDLVVHSSEKEGCPNAVLEAMAVAKPVIGTDISGMRQALGDRFKTLCLAKPGNEQDWSQRILMFLNDKVLREEVGKYNIGRIKEQFSVERMACSFLTLIRETQE